MSQITHGQLKQILKYDPDTGVFIWVKIKGSNAQAGDVAGCKTQHGYLVIRINNILYYAHRLAFLYMTGCWPHAEIDHIDGVGNNNKWGNLRDVNRQANLRNSALYKSNKSGCVGVVFYKRDGNWQAQITVSGKHIFLGRFAKKSEAISARKRAEILYQFHPNHGRAAPVS